MTDAPNMPPAPPPPDGLVDERMTRLLGRSWRTSLSGALSIICGAIAAVGYSSPGLIDPRIVGIAIALAPLIGGAGLMFAKDARVSSAQQQEKPK